MSPGSVGIVIPVHNGEKYLAEALRSCLGQSRSPAEVWVIDDGSSDRSMEIAASFGGPVRCDSQAHAGAAAARNLGIQRVTSDFLAFLDADDYWNPEKIEIQARYLEDHPDCSMVFGSVLAFHSPELSEAQRRTLATPPPMIGRVPGSMLIRREAFLRVGPFATHWGAGEFLEWYGRAQGIGLSEATTEGAWLHRRIHGANSMLRQPASQADYLRILKQGLDRKRQSGGAKSE